MKRIFLSALAFVCVAMSVMAQNIDYSRGAKWRLANVFPVKGGEGIEQFYMALMPGVSEYYKLNNITSLEEDEEGTYDIDKKNGYIRYFQEGAGGLQMQCCYWKREDGTKLVGFYYDEHSEDVEHQRMNCESFLQFYTYNTTLNVLEPIRDPFDMEMPEKTHFVCQLPQTGKDVKYRFGLEEEDGEWSTLKWNGIDFRASKGTPAKTLKTGRHMLSLQWIEGVKYGACDIQPTGNAGEYTIKGEHCSKDKSNYLKIDGTLTVVNSKRLKFNGTIKTSVYHIAGGAEQVRRGNYDFVAEGQRKYWRLQQYCNPGDGCCDYVDIYF